MLVPLDGNTGDRSASVYSLALAFRDVMRRWTRRVIPSALPRRRGNHSLRDKLSHPARTSRPAACTAPMRKRRRSSRMFFFMCPLRFCNSIPASDHGPEVIPQPRDCHQGQVDHDEADECKAGKEVNSTRRLPATEKREEAGERGINHWRHGQASQDNQRSQPEHHAGVSDLLQHIVALRLFPTGMAKEKMVEERAPKATQILPPGEQISREMPA